MISDEAWHRYWPIIRERRNNAYDPKDVDFATAVIEGFPEKRLKSKKNDGKFNNLMIRRTAVLINRRYNCRTNWAKRKASKADKMEIINLGYWP